MPASGFSRSWVVKAMDWYLAVSPEYRQQAQGGQRG
jgi:hypothetical protein